MVKKEKEDIMYFTLSCNMKDFTYVVCKHMAYEMYKILVDRYKPKEEDDYLTLSNMFMNCKMIDEDEYREFCFMR